MKNPKSTPTTTSNATKFEKLQSERMTATLSEHRLRIFDPTRRPKYRKKLRLESSWGIIEKTGKCGQVHADFVDAIFYCREKTAEMQDGRIKLLVDPAKVRRVAGISSGSQLNDLKTEIMEVVIKIIDPVKMACEGHIIDHIDIAKHEDGNGITRFNPLSRRKKDPGPIERELWRVEVGKALCKLLYHDLWLGYDPTPIAQLRHGISQAIARNILTHKNKPNGGWILDNLIRSVEENLSGTTLRDRRRDVRNDAEKLKEIGISIDGDRVHILKVLDL